MFIRNKEITLTVIYRRWALSCDRLWIHEALQQSEEKLGRLLLVKTLIGILTFKLILDPRPPSICFYLRKRPARRLKMLACLLFLSLKTGRFCKLKTEARDLVLNQLPMLMFPCSVFTEIHL